MKILSNRTSSHVYHVGLGEDEKKRDKTRRGEALSKPIKIGNSGYSVLRTVEKRNMDWRTFGLAAWELDLQKVRAE